MERRVPVELAVGGDGEPHEVVLALPKIAALALGHAHHLHLVVVDDDRPCRAAPIWPKNASMRSAPITATGRARVDVVLR